MDSINPLCPARVSIWRIVTLAAFGLAIGGCANGKRPTDVFVTQVAPYVNPAKPPDCAMPVLDTEPIGVPYRQVAIVEAWADIKDTETDVLPELKRQACGTGADALMVIEGKSQDVKSLLYAATPNTTETQVTASNNSDNQAGQYLSMMEHTRRIGEEGHSGYYIDAIAIDYITPADKTAAAH